MNICTFQAHDAPVIGYLHDDHDRLVSHKTRPALVICAGGCYRWLSPREKDPVALHWAALGYQTFLIEYSTEARASGLRPLRELAECVRILRLRAEEWHIDPGKIAVLGFSAGGHLAACAATMSRHRPAAAILGYPVIDGDCARDYLPSAPDVPSAVTPETCPCFIFATRTDNLVPVHNAVHLIDALCANDIAFESHIYANGPHGLSTGDASINGQDFSARYCAWVEDSIAWLSDVLGGVTAQGLTPPRFGSRINGNREKTLNLDCTMKYLMEHPQGKAFLDETFHGRQTGFPSAAAGVITLRDSLRYAGLDSDALRAIEKKLENIENIREE